MKQSYAHDVFLAEEISRQIKINIGEVIVPPIPESVKTTEVRPTTSHIINHHIKANVWTEIKLSQDIEGWQMSCRDNFDIHYCFEPSHSTYKTLKAGAIVSEDTSPNKTLNAIYVRCENSTIVEIEIWKT